LFPNGNGRHARIIADALLKYEGSLESIPWGDQELGASSEHRHKYIEALRLADKNDYSLLKQIFLNEI
jgi:fido (protein-threonine AMPylation protein)